MANEVGLDVSGGVLDAVADPGLRPKMDDTIEIDLVGEGLECIGVSEIEPLEPEAISEVVIELTQASLF